MPAYLYCSPPVPAAVGKVYLDLFNAAGSGKVVDVRGLWLVPKIDVALTGLVAVRGDLYRTTTAGTGGAAAVRDNAASAAPDPAGGAFSKYAESDPDLPALVTARVAPAGGAALGRWLLPWQPKARDYSKGPSGRRSSPARAWVGRATRAGHARTSPRRCPARRASCSSSAWRA